MQAERRIANVKDYFDDGLYHNWEPQIKDFFNAFAFSDLNELLLGYRLEIKMKCLILNDIRIILGM